MNDQNSQVSMISVGKIDVLNPRARDKHVFSELVTSIAHLGLKKPITVSEREDKTGYDLVCGQGRLEAYASLGQSEIPAVVIKASKEDCYVMSLVENMARCQHSSLELMREIGNLKKRGYSINQIALKTDFSGEYISAICILLERGEERLIRAVERGVMPPTIAIEIARAKDAEVQQALADAYESKTLPGNQVLAIRRIIEQRNVNGKTIHGGARTKLKKQLSSRNMVRAYRKETDRQKLLIKKAALAQSRLLFVVNALRRLLDDEHFATLLRAEAMHTLPRPLAERLGLTWA